MRLHRDPPIRCPARERSRHAVWVNSQFWQRLVVERPVGRQFQINKVVDERVAAGASYKFRIGAVDLCRGRRSRRNVRPRVRKTPGRRRVPRVLDGRIVVGGDAVDDIHIAQLAGVGITQIGVVPCPFAVPARIGGNHRRSRRGIDRGPAGRRIAICGLRKQTDMIGNGAAIEKAELSKVGVIVCVIRRQHRLVRFGVRIAVDRHHRDGRHPDVARVRPAAQRGAVSALGFFSRKPPSAWSGSRRRRKKRRAEPAAARRIAVQFEQPPVRGETRVIGMAGAAGLPGLAGETRQCLRRLAGQEYERDKRCRTKSDGSKLARWRGVEQIGT